MLISAISMNDNDSAVLNTGFPYYNHSNEPIGDTSFNSLTSFRKSIQQDKLPQVLDNINEWKDFCHKQILGEKLDIIA